MYERMCPTELYVPLVVFPLVLFLQFIHFVLLIFKMLHYILDTYLYV